MGPFLTAFRDRCEWALKVYGANCGFTQWLPTAGDHVICKTDGTCMSQLSELVRMFSELESESVVLSENVDIKYLYGTLSDNWVGFTTVRPMNQLPAKFQESVRINKLGDELQLTVEGASVLRTSQISAIVDANGLLSWGTTWLIPYRARRLPVRVDHDGYVVYVTLGDVEDEELLDEVRIHGGSGILHLTGKRPAKRRWHASTIDPDGDDTPRLTHAPVHVRSATSTSRLNDQWIEALA